MILDFFFALPEDCRKVSKIVSTICDAFGHGPFPLAPLRSDEFWKTVWNCVWSRGCKPVQKCQRKTFLGQLNRAYFGVFLELFVSLFILEFKTLRGWLSEFLPPLLYGLLGDLVAFGRTRGNSGKCRETQGNSVEFSGAVCAANHSFRNHYILNSRTIKSCNCNCRQFFRIPEKNYFLQLHSARETEKM